MTTNTLELTKQHSKVRKLVAAVAHAQGNKVVDLAQIENGVRIAILERAIEEIWQAFDAGLPAEIAEPALQALEQTQDEALIEALGLGPRSIAELRAAQPAEHRAARGVRKVRGAK
jgi:hypothetical protein